MMHKPDPKHTAFLDELKATLGSSGKDIDAVELLAVTSQFVGMLIALQDQRRYSPQAAMEVVIRNIEIGNHTAISVNFMETKGSA